MKLDFVLHDILLMCLNRNIDFLCSFSSHIAKSSGTLKRDVANFVNFRRVLRIGSLVLCKFETFYFLVRVECYNGIVGRCLCCQCFCRTRACFVNAIDTVALISINFRNNVFDFKVQWCTSHEHRACICCVYNFNNCVSLR